jgi:hypothetical protein
MELFTSATRIGIEGIDARADVRKHNSSFVLLPQLKYLILQGEGNIFAILDKISLPKIETTQIILRHPLAGRCTRISAAASLERFMYRHQHSMSITIKVKVRKRVPQARAVFNTLRPLFSVATLILKTFRVKKRSKFSIPLMRRRREGGFLGKSTNS